MKLSALLISNFKGIKEEVKILIDSIVILIGPNNCCKSTILDAYEAYTSLGSALSLDFFNNRNPLSPIIITGVFVDISADDIESIGQEWILDGDAEFGQCAKFQIRWETPDEAGTKYSYSNKTNDWKKGGAGGWDSKLKSRLPTPIRINPNDGTDALEKIVKDLIAKSASEKIKADKSKLEKIINEIEVLAKEIEKELLPDIDKINKKIENEAKKLFSNLEVKFETGVGKIKPEDIIKDGRKFILKTNGSSAPLEHQGTGVKRAFLWSAISALCSEGKFKKGKTTISNEEQKILLLDEPEINLHPSVIRSARKAIYALSEVTGWQVMCTTHSPIFIDLTQNHTTLIKASNTQNGIYYFQTDKSSFSNEEKENLKMLNKCCPTVNEFFFYETAILVEGDTEYLAYQYLIERDGLEGSHCVINCRGKGNIPTFIKIFDQFQSSAIAIHDLDDKIKSDGSKNGIWTLNIKIREAADITNGRVKTVVHKPDFEGYYFSESPKKDKPYNLFSHLTSPSFETDEMHRALRESLTDIVNGTHKGIYNAIADIEALA